MRFAGSLLFNVFFFAYTAGIMLVMFFLLPFHYTAMHWAVRQWGVGTRAALRLLCGIDHEVRGREHMPKGGAVFACKHQSAWDVMIFHAISPLPAYVLKKELMRIPLWGWYATKARAIPVDRSAGMRALKDVTRRARGVIAAGRHIVLFPQGTRTAPGAKRPYHPGVYAIYADTGATVVPVALNSGLFWGRRKFIKKPGTIVIEVLPAMPPGLDRRAFMAELERRIEDASDRLAAEGRAKFPWVAEG